MSDLTDLLADGVSETRELASARATLDEIAQHVCAMLNQRGGAIVWGVERGRIAGLPDAAHRMRRLTDHLARHVRPRPLVSATIERSATHEVIVVDVPAATDKPYALDHEIWIRIATQTLRATPSKSATLVERSAARLDRWEREPSPELTIEDCSREELSQTRTELAANGRFGEEVPRADEDLLRKLYLIRSGQLTNAAIVLFAAKPRQWAPNVALRITTYAGPTKGAILLDATLDGPAVRVVREAIAIIQQRTGFSGTFDHQRLAREDRPAYALFALREGLVNAVVHRDYSALGEVRIEIYPDSLLIRNPGRLPDGWKVQDLRHEHASQPVNPDIAQVFYLRGLMEQLGMGTQRLVAECKALRAKAPAWSVERGTVSLRLFRAPVQAALAPRQTNFLARRKAATPFALREYATAAGVSERQARRDLTELERIGAVERRGKGPATMYVRRS